MAEGWSDEERDCLDKAYEHATNAENWLDELDTDSVPTVDGFRVSDLQSMAYRLRKALDQLVTDLIERDEPTAAGGEAPIPVRRPPLEWW